MEIRQLIGLVRGGLGIVLAVTIVAALAALLVASRLPVVYEARASLITQSMASTYAEVARSRPLLGEVIDSLDLDVTADALAERVHARASQTAALLTVTVRDGDARRAAAIANAIAELLVDRAPTISGLSPDRQAVIEEDLEAVERDIERTEGIIEELASLPDPDGVIAREIDVEYGQLASLLALRTSLQSAAISYAQAAVTVLEPADVPARPASPNVPLVGLIGGLAGLVIGLGFVLVPGYIGEPRATGRARRDE